MNLVCFYKLEKDQVKEKNVWFWCEKGGFELKKCYNYNWNNWEKYTNDLSVITASSAQI